MHEYIWTWCDQKHHDVNIRQLSLRNPDRILPRQQQNSCCVTKLMQPCTHLNDAANRGWNSASTCNSNIDFVNEVNMTALDFVAGSDPREHACKFICKCMRPFLASHLHVYK
jgi:hypothetical protein